MPDVAILGAGSWGSALAWLLGSKGGAVRLWGRDPAVSAAVQASRRNERSLPGIDLPPSVTATADLQAALAGAPTVLVVVPAQAVRETLRAARAALAPGVGVVLAAKGLERGSGKRLSEVAREELGDAARIAVLSGPNLAGEIVKRVPTATVVGSEHAEFAHELQEIFATSEFRVYGNPDIAGVELGGALKNPIAVAGGIGDGLGFGNNTKASLLTRGLAEMTRLGVAAGGRAATFSGLSGLGDLMATAYSPLSRNYRLGFALGQGTKLEDALRDLGHVAEGVPTADAACVLADRLQIEAPVMRELREILFSNKRPADAVADLMTRPYRDEDQL